VNQKRRFLRAGAPIACCLLALLIIAASRATRGSQSVAVDVNVSQIKLTPNFLTVDLAPDPGGYVSFIGFSGSPSNAQIGGFVTSSGVVTAAPFPSSGTNVTVPQSITKGADGNLWVPYYIHTPSLSSVESGVFRVTASYTFSKFTFASPAACEITCRSTVGADGNVWMALNATGTVARITTTGAITEYPLPSAHNPSDITLGPDNNLWSVYEKGLDRITPAGTVTTLVNPQAAANLQRITKGPDANLWVTDTGTNSIWRATTSGSWTQYSIPTANSLPTGIAALSDGNIWFGEFDASNIGQLTLANGTLSQFSMPGSNHPLHIINSQVTSPNAYIVALDSNFDPHPFSLSFGAGVTPTITPMPGTPTPTPTPCVPPITIQRFGDNACRVGDSCLIEFEPSGGSYTYSISNTVPGMSFDGGQGRLDGTPTIPGDYTFTVTVTDSRGCKASLTVTLQVEPARDASLLILEGLRHIGPR
jgi:streptogramin lyase